MSGFACCGGHIGHLDRCHNSPVRLKVMHYGQDQIVGDSRCLCMADMQLNPDCPIHGLPEFRIPAASGPTETEAP